MWLSPSKFLFGTRIFLSVFIISSSPSFLMRWVGLELNTLAFIPILVTVKTKLRREAGVKYFLTQTLASVLFVLGSILVSFNLIVLTSLLFLVGLSIKLGAAPFHRWLMTVGESCSWVVFLILLTIQKINPLLILWNSVVTDILLFSFLVAGSVLVGGFIGLAQTSSRLILIFSSVNHVGWMLSGLMSSLWLTIIYFLIYFLILTPATIIFKKLSIRHINQLVGGNLNLEIQLIVFILLFSLGGLPPFLGFMPKWVVLQSLIGSGGFILSLIFISISLFTLFYYLRLIVRSFLLLSLKRNFSYSNINLNFLLILMFSFSILGLPSIFMF